MSRRAAETSPDEQRAGTAAPAGSALYYALRLAPAERRPAVAAVHAFCRDVSAVARGVRDANVALAKLGWWRSEIAAAYAARARHPVAQALVPAIASFALAQPHFEALIDGAAQDVKRQVYPDFAALEAHCRSVGGSLWLLSARILGSEAAHDYARDLGAALQLTASIRRLGADLRHGLVYLPQDELARFGVTFEQLGSRCTTPALAALMAQHTQRVRCIYARALAALPPLERRRQRPGRVMAAIGVALLDEIERDGFQVLDRRMSLTPLAKAWIAWKTSWQR